MLGLPDQAPEWRGAVLLSPALLQVRPVVAPQLSPDFAPQQQLGDPTPDQEGLESPGLAGAACRANLLPPRQHAAYLLAAAQLLLSFQGQVLLPDQAARLPVPLRFAHQQGECRQARACPSFEPLPQAGPLPPHSPVNTPSWSAHAQRCCTCPSPAAIMLRGVLMPKAVMAFLHVSANFRDHVGDFHEAC